MSRFGANLARVISAVVVLTSTVLGIGTAASAAPALGTNISIEFSGTAPFADYGASGLEPGDDLSGGVENGFDGLRHYVRTGDTSSIKLEYSVNGDDATHLALEATIVEVDAAGVVIGPAPAGITFPTLPPVCQGGSVLAADGQSMTCFVGAIPSGTTAFVTTQVKADNTVQNSTRYQVQYKAVEQDEAIETPELLTDTIVVSSAPRFDLWKKSARSNTPFTAPAGHPLAGEAGGVFVFNLGILAGDGDARGLSMLAEYDANSNGVADPGEDLNGNGTLDNVVTFSDSLAAFPAGSALLDFGPYGDGCGTNGGAQPGSNIWFFSSAPGGGLQPTYADDRETPDSGIWDCSQTGDTITVTITNADWRGERYPSKTINGTTMSADQKWMASGHVSVWVPASEIRNGADGIAGNADDGQFPITNTAGGFDPDDIWGLNNYGPSGTEPLIDDANLGHRRNALDYTLVEGGIGWDKFFRKDIHPNSAWSSPVTNATAHYTGDGQVMDGTTFGTYQTLINSSFERREGVQLCDSFDNSTYVLSPDANNRLSGIYFSGSSVDPALPSALTPANVLLEYGTGINGGVAGNWADGNHAVPSLPATWGGDDHWQRPGWDLQQQISCGDADSANGWFTLDSPFDPADLPAGVTLADITKYRLRIVHPDIVATGDWRDQSILPPGMRITSTTRHEALPGLIDVTPGDGDASNAYPTILANFATREFRDTDGTTNTFTNNYDPADHSNRSGSDRLTLTKAQVRIDKEYLEKVAGSGPNFLAGDDVTWTLAPTVAQLGDIVAPPATDVRVVDEFPVPLEYVSGSASPAAFVDLVSGTSYPVQFCLVAGCDKDNASHWSATEPADSLTVLGLMWDLGEVPLGTELPIFSYTTSIPLDTSHNTDFVNTATIHSPDDNANEARRSDTTSIKALQVGAFAVRKKVFTPVIFTDEVIEWELQYANVSAVDTTFDLIDILPWNGDGGAALADPRTIPSDYTGSLQLMSVVPDAGNAASVVYYTTAAPGTINENPDAASNVLTAGLWCSNDDASVGNLGTAGCPAADLSDATAFRVIGGPLLGSASGTPSGMQRIRVDAQTVGNAPIDFYANEFVAKVPDSLIVLPVKSNEVYTRVWGGSIGDLVFNDIDKNGLFDAAADSPIPAVAVELIDAAGAVIDTATTDAGGRYIFDFIVRPGDFRVRLAASNFAAGGPLFAMAPTINPAADPNVDLNENNDHDTVTALAGGNYESGVLSLGVGTEPVTEDIANKDTSGAVDTDSNLTLDFGLILPVPGISIEKRVQDPINAGSFVESIDVEPGDTATFQIVVTNTGEIDLANVAVSDPLLAACDNAIGSLASGATVTYTCNQVMTTGLNPNTAAVSGDPVDGQTAVTDNDTASVTVVGKIGDTIWFDVDANGTQDAGEPGIAGVLVTVTWFGPDGVAGGGDDVVNNVVTDAFGKYLVEGLPPGEYSVVVDPTTLPAGYTQTYDADGLASANASALTLGDGEANLDQDFGYTGTGSIGDTVWIDANGDGVVDGNESGIGNVAVAVTWFGPDGVVGGGDDVVYNTTTDGSGKYLVENLPAGAYSVAVDPATLPVGLSATFDADGIGTSHSSELNLAAGEDNLDQDFGYNGSGSIGDTIWLDSNGDGVIDAGESGIADVDVTVTWFGPDGVAGGGDDVVYNTTTDADGKYLVTNLPPGEYSVTVDPATLPGGVAQTFDEDGALDNSTSFSLAEGANHLSADFGYQGSGTIGDTIWFDVNGDGVQDANESGLAGVAVSVTWFGPDGVAGGGDDVVYPATTDADGKYLVENLPAGAYEVAVDPATLPAGMTQTFDADGTGSANTSSLDLGNGETNLDQDFGYNGNAQIGDTVWFDVNADGIQDGGEPPLAGVEITVTWFGPDGVAGGGDDVVLPPATTDANGNYSVSGLPDGNYDVSVTGVPAGFTNTYDEDGDNDSQTDVTGLSAGDNHDTADFGFTASGSIGDTIYWDTDGDGTQGPSEPGLAGVDVTVTWLGPDGVAGGGDDVVYNTTTDADGKYLVENLPPGAFTVVVDTADLPAGMIQSADPDGVNDAASSLSLSAGEANLDQDFGFKGNSSIGDFVWYDLNGDGVQDPDEPGVSGVPVTVTYYGADGVVGGGDDVVFTTITDANGNYLVDGLAEGNYGVAIDTAGLPAGLSANSDLDGGDPTAAAVTLGANEDRRDVDFGIVGDATLGHVVWNDSDGDGIQDPGETGVPGVTVVVTWAGPNGPVVTEVVTAADGTWELSNLPPGDYTVTLKESTLPAGKVPTTATTGSVTLNPGDSKEVNFGIATAGSIGSTVWMDIDKDGVVDSTESGIAGVTVTLLDADGNLVATRVTDANGNYIFTELPPGSYTIEIVASTLPANIRQVFERDGGNNLSTPVSLDEGAAVQGINFGFVPNSATLAFTGSNGNVAALALAMIIGGFMLLGLAKKRKPLPLRVKN